MRRRGPTPAGSAKIDEKRVAKVYLDHFDSSLGYCTLSFSALAKRFGCTSSGIESALRRAGVYTPQPKARVPLTDRRASGRRGG